MRHRHANEGGARRAHRHQYKEKRDKGTLIEDAGGVESSAGPKERPDDQYPRPRARPANPLDHDRRSGGGQAALKLGIGNDLVTGRLDGPHLRAARPHDRLLPIQDQPVAPAALRLADLGFFDLAVLTTLTAQRAYRLTRLQVGTVVFDGAGARLDLATLLRTECKPLLDLPVLLGVRVRLPCRLLAERIPKVIADERGRWARWEWRKGGERAGSGRRYSGTRHGGDAKEGRVSRHQRSTLPGEEPPSCPQSCSMSRSSRNTDS